MPDYSFETAADKPVCGIDEAGRGPLAGPVVAAAVVLDAANIPEGLDDSKALSPKKREGLFDVIRNYAQVGVGIASVQEIDELNILGATKLAMQRAFAALPIAPVTALIDGNQPPTLPCTTIPIIKGDSKSVSIATASIIAKVTRDRIMQGLGQQHPEYGFEKHAGYGTAFHLQALKTHGITPHHRRSFAPVREVLEQWKVVQRKVVA